jgi:phage baseplate assembly protein W
MATEDDIYFKRRLQDPYVNRQPDYKDLDLDFFADPTTKDVIKKVGTEAIKRSVRNLVFTNFYEKPFRHYIGSDVRDLLFENATPLTTIYIKDAIVQLLENFEPRIKLNDVTVKEDLDNNGYNISLVYTIRNRELQVTSSLFLERIR